MSAADHRPKHLLCLIGESFRLGNQGSRNVGAPDSVPRQDKASASHMALVSALEEKYGIECHIAVLTYATPHTKLLLEAYGAKLVSLVAHIDPQGYGKLFRQSLHLPNAESYQSLMVCRIDLVLNADLLASLYNPTTNDRVLFPSICWIVGRLTALKYPRISDTMMMIPRKWLKPLRDRQDLVLRHETFEDLRKHNLIPEAALGFLLTTYHDSDSAKDWNPLYYMTGREQCKTWHSAGSEYDAKRNPRPSTISYPAFP